MKEILILKESIGKVTMPSDIFTKIEKIKIDYIQENFLIFYLDTKNKLIKSEVLFKGGLNTCIVCIKTIFRKALKYKSNSIIIAHNHPSGCLEPSDEDITFTEGVKNAGDIIGIKCLDSIIFNKKEFYTIK
jgi:DNA repair protein RadC